MRVQHSETCGTLRKPVARRRGCRLDRWLPHPWLCPRGPLCAVMAPPPSPTHENKAGGRPATRQGVPAPLTKKGKTQKRSLRRPLPPLPLSVCWLPVGGGPEAAAVPKGEAHSAGGGPARRKEPGPAALATTGQGCPCLPFVGGEGMLQSLFPLCAGFARSWGQPPSPQASPQRSRPSGCRPRRQPGRATPRTGFGASSLCPFFGGESFRKPVPGVAMSQCAGGATPQPVLRQGFSQTLRQPHGVPR